MADFASIPSGTQLVFESAGTLCVNISIEDDQILEDEEVFFVQLTTNDIQVVLSRPLSNVTILDNDGKSPAL